MKKIKKCVLVTAKKEDIKYEADSVAYKADNVDSNDLTETTEYEEDDERHESGRFKKYAKGIVKAQ